MEGEGLRIGSSVANRRDEREGKGWK